jgi:glycosyltransferase involved in cell wall biosynthesis
MKISVIIPAYNAASYISRAIESCFWQTCPPHEIVVADDGSTDETAAIAARFGPPVRVVRLPQNVGVPVARNAAIKVSTGDWLAFLDADDWFLPEKLERQERCAGENPKAVLIYSAFRTSLKGVESSGRFYPPVNLWPMMRYRCPLQVCTVLLRRSAFEAVGDFDPSLPGVEDWDMWLRVMERYSSSSFAAVPEELGVYRITPGSLSSIAMRTHQRRAALVETRCLQGLSGFRRRLWRRRIDAFRYYDSSLALREEGSSMYLQFMMKSLAAWPFPGETTPVRRFKVAAAMTKQRLLTKERV